MTWNNKKLAFIAAFVLLGFVSAEGPEYKPEITIASAMHSEQQPEYITLSVEDKKACLEASASQAHIDAAAMVNVPHTTLSFDQKPLTLTFKKFSTVKGHDAVLVGYQVSEKDILFSHQASHIKSIQAHINGSEKFVVFEGPKEDGKFYRSTVLLFKQDWDRFRFSLAGQAAKRAFYEYVTRRARDLVTDPERKAKHFIKQLGLRIPKGVRFMIISHPACPEEVFPVSLMTSQQVVHFDSRPETKLYRIQNVFNEEGNYGVFYEIGHNLAMQPNMEKLKDRSAWEMVPKFTASKGDQRFTVYFKIRGLSVPSREALEELTKNLIASYDQVNDALTMRARWMFLLSTDQGLPADWFEHLCVLTKKVKILVVRNVDSNKTQ